jgi:tetratricopeptide (TPR) repeat protein
MKLRAEPTIVRETWSKYLLGIFFILPITLTIPPPANPTTPPPQLKPIAPIPPTVGPLRQQQARILEESDGPFQIWEEKDKYFLVITVDHTGLKATDIDLPRVDGPKVANTFSMLGYKPLLENHRYLNGKQSNRDNVLSALQLLKNLAPPATVIVYYSGHGVTSETEPHLWLQLSGQDSVGPGHGITLSEVLKTPRMLGYNGELIVIVDASYSGKTPLSEAFELQGLGENTIILSSSSVKQHSQTLRLPDGNKSAFTHTMVKALGSQWSTADENRDGILSFSELNTFTRIQLRGHFQNNDIPELMKPKLIRPQRETLFIAYQRDQIQQWGTDDRQALQVLALERALSPSMSRGKNFSKTASGKLVVSKRAKLLAQPISSNTHDLYTQGLIALAQGTPDEARTLLAQAAENEVANSKKLAKVYLARGRTEIYAGRIRLALVWYKKALTYQRPVDAKLLNEFGLIWVKAGLLEEALPFFEEGLTLRERALDPMDPSLAVSLNNLAGLYHHLGKFSEAEPLYQRSLQITENALGPEDLSLVIQLNNLARLYRDQGKYTDAEPLYQRALQITERSLGPEHPKVAAALNNLALVYKAQAKYTMAEPLYLRVVQIDEATFGPTHPKVAYDLNTLALMYRAQGKDAEAEPLYQRLVEIDEATLGPDHPEVATDLNNLAELYRDQGKYAEAEPLYQRSYAINRRQLGLTHPNTRTVLNNYLRMLNKSGQTDKARRINEEYQQAVRAQSASGLPLRCPLWKRGLGGF